MGDDPPSPFGVGFMIRLLFDMVAATTSLWIMNGREGLKTVSDLRLKNVTSRSDRRPLWRFLTMATIGDC